MLQLIFGNRVSENVFQKKLLTEVYSHVFRPKKFLKKEEIRYILENNVIKTTDVDDC